MAGIVANNLLTTEFFTLDTLPNLATPVQPLAAFLLDNPTGKGEFEELCWQWLHGLPAGLRLGQIKTLEFADAEREHRRFEFDSQCFRTNAQGKDEPVGQIMVSLYRKPGTPGNEVYLELEQAQVWLSELRGQHIGTTIVANVRALGAKLGVKAVTALAMYDGRWVWPLLGFRFGDYLPEEGSRRKFIKAFRVYCRRHKVEPPASAELAVWDAPHIARFRPDVLVAATIGHPSDAQPSRQMVGLGRAFLLSRQPFFVTYPITI